MPSPNAPLTRPGTPLSRVPTTLPSVAKLPTLPVYRNLPPTRERIPLPPITPARPSINLGSAIHSSQIAAPPHLLPHVEATNPIPFRVLNPKQNPVSTNYGSRVSNAIHALQKPTAAHVPGQKPVTNFGHRVVSAIRAVTRS